MTEEILDAPIRTDAQVEARIADIRRELVQQSNRRSLERTLADAEQGYAVLVRGAVAVVEGYVERQAAYLRAYGSGTGMAQWASVAHLAESEWLLADDAGPQRLLAQLRSLEYGLSLAEYNQHRQVLQDELAGLERRLAQQRFEREKAQLESKYPGIAGA